MSQRVPESESEWARESQRTSQREPGRELEGLKVSLRVTLGPNPGCKSQPRQSELENIDFPQVFSQFMLQTQILRSVFEGESHQVP